MQLVLAIAIFVITTIGFLKVVKYLSSENTGVSVWEDDRHVFDILNNVPGDCPCVTIVGTSSAEMLTASRNDTLIEEYANWGSRQVVFRGNVVILPEGWVGSVSRIPNHPLKIVALKGSK